MAREKFVSEEEEEEVYEMGYDRGRSVASWIDIPEIGMKIPKDIDWIGHEEVTEDNISDVMEMEAGEAESNSRQYSPFEFTAQELNEMEDDENLDFDPWEVFEEGIADGIRDEISERLAEE